MVRMGSGLRKRPHFGQTVVDGKLNSAGDGHGNYLSSSAFVDAAKADGVTKWFDNVYDVTIVKIDLANSDAFSPAKLEFSSKVRVGDLVFTYGFPQCYPRSLSMGIIR
ncbi:unnamed protein product [Arabis nemorensis]|uniref:Uncharacterized protein n=1 Tax=Arabis nemorensis TaxID=586526 RepID=A0A565ANJ6_9BRAS|nr:unnamed protein product [Arabis nemorensis]